MKLPDGFTLRAPTVDDAQGITELIGKSDIEDYGELDYSTEDLYADWRREGFQLERDAWLIYAPNHLLVAYGNVWDSGPRVRVDPSTCVHPQYRACGLEDSLMERAEEWTREYATVKTIQWIVNAEQARWVQRFEARGYAIIRHDWVMEIVMNEPPPAPIVHKGIVLRSFERGRDERAVWACIQESFRDTWGHVDDYSFNAWATWIMDHADWSAEISCVAQDGDEIAGAAMAFNFPNIGWIRQLGVRRPWRRQGIALAMLYRVFGEFYRRGVKKVGLGVDAESVTVATQLYERVGMRIKNHFVRYEKAV